jgi:WD40 repeat protein
VITAGDDGEIHELRDGQSVRRLGSGGAIKTLARLDDGTLITASADGTIVVRDRDGRELRRFAGGVTGTPSPDGRQIATATSDGTVAIWDPAIGTLIRTLGNVSRELDPLVARRRRVAALRCSATCPCGTSMAAGPPDPEGNIVAANTRSRTTASGSLGGEP